MTVETAVVATVEVEVEVVTTASETVSLPTMTTEGIATDVPKMHRGGATTVERAGSFEATPSNRVVECITRLNQPFE